MSKLSFQPFKDLEKAFLQEPSINIFHQPQRFEGKDLISWHLLVELEDQASPEKCFVLPFLWEGIRERFSFLITIIAIFVLAFVAALHVLVKVPHRQAWSLRVRHLAAVLRQG